MKTSARYEKGYETFERYAAKVARTVLKGLEAGDGLQLLNSLPDFTVRAIAYPSQPTSNNSVEAPFMYRVQLSYIRETDPKKKKKLEEEIKKLKDSIDNHEQKHDNWEKHIGLLKQASASDKRQKEEKLIREVHIAFLNSSPLVWQNKNGHLHPMDMLDFNAECDLLFNSFDEAGRAINVRIECATTDNLRTLVTIGCRVLHYSGHGHQDFLAFEDGRGCVHPIRPDKLKELFAAGATQGVQLVFVSACHSRNTAEAFVAAGVPHVVAIGLETPVYDYAASTFARAFYLALLAGRTVKQAFDIGKAAVANLPDISQQYESEKFLLLPEYGIHDTIIFSDVPEGEWCNITQQCQNNLPAMPQNFTGRNLSMHNVINDILDGRLVTVRGAPGIGKTALSIASAHYICERRLFRDGAFFISLRDVKSKDAVRFAVAYVLGITAKDDEELLVALRKRRLLLVLDNCEDPIHYAGSDFRKFLAQMLQQAKDIKLLLTSRETLRGGLPGVAEKIQSLRRLDPLDAASLFIVLAPRKILNSR